MTIHDFCTFEIAVYSSMVDWDTCAYLLFCQEEGIFCGYLLQVGNQFLFGSLCSCGGEYSGSAAPYSRVHIM